METWSLAQAVALTGTPKTALLRACQDGLLEGPELFPVAQLFEWLQGSGRPYRKEVTELSFFVSLTQASQLYPGQTWPQALPVFLWEDQGWIARRHLDHWLEGQGLPPTWKVESADWLTVKSAADFLGVAQPTIQKWITSGQLHTKRRGRLWLVSRSSLLEQRQRFGAEAVRDFLTVEAAARHFKIAHLALVRAIQEGALASHQLGEGRYWRRYLKPCEVQAWMEKRPARSGKVQTPPRRCPSQAAKAYSVAEASALCRRSIASLRRAIHQGELKTCQSPQGLTIKTKELNRWLEWLFHRGGGTDDSTMISLREAARQADCTEWALRCKIRAGTFTARFNPANFPILVREEWEAWLKVKPVSPPQDHYTLRHIAQMLGMNVATVQKDVTRGRLAATMVTGAPPRLMVSESEFKRWITIRSQGYTSAPLRGDELTTRQVCQRYGCSFDLLKQGRDRGLVPCSRRFYKNGTAYWWGSLDVEDYLAQRDQGNHAWTLTRIADITGINWDAVRVAMQEGGPIQVRVEHFPGLGPRRVAELESLLDWLEMGAPPYRKEVAHLSPFVSSKLAGKVSGLGQTSVVKALRAKELSAFELIMKSGPRYFIPRYQFDQWLSQRNLPPSWELQDEEDWLTVNAAAQLIDVANPTIHKWIKIGALEVQRRGRRWLVGRQRLLAKAREYRPNLEQYVRLEEAGPRFQIEPAQLDQAVQQGRLLLHVLGSGPGRRQYFRLEEVQAWLDRG